MKTSELIQRLKDHDPTGDRDVVIIPDDLSDGESEFTVEPGTYEDGTGEVWIVL